MIRLLRLSLAVLVVIVGMARAAQALTVASPFSSNMVLQQGVAVPVWGTARPGEEVTVKFAGQTLQGMADAQGKWHVTLKPLSVNDVGEMCIQAAEKITLSNVLVGEVWLCSGQSNMTMSLARASNGKSEIAKANLPKIRFLKVALTSTDTPQETVEGKWELCAPQSAAAFSAASYFFGRDLHRSLDVPIGLIDASWGGTEIECWTSADALNTVPAYREAIQQMLAKPVATPEEEQVLLAYRKARRAGTTLPTNLPKGKRSNHGEGPTRMFNGMISPLIPFAIKGVIWYQGESNVAQHRTYDRLLGMLISDWRKRWNAGDFPFLFVQLPNHGTRVENALSTPWSLLREAQARAAALPNVGMAVTIDTSSDGNLHPREKEPVGQRLALIALGQVYGKDVAYQSPTFGEMKFERDRVIVTFKPNSPLLARGGKPVGFWVAGDDQIYHRADATIDGSHVVLVAVKVSTPKAVRYAWGDNPQCNVYSADGLPLAPFRTDNWVGADK